MTLNRSVGAMSLLLLSIGSIIGSGWLLGPFYAAKIAGPASIIAWPLGGILLMFVALSFAELAAMFPVIGGTIQFLQASHGTFVSYTFAWIGWISSAAIAPIETLAMLQYATHYLPWLMHYQDGVYLLTQHGRWVGAGVLLLMCYINIIGVRSLARTNSILTTWKILVPTLTVIILLTMHFNVKNFSTPQFFAADWPSIFMSLPNAGVIYAFLGFTTIIQLAGEAKRPQFSIPFAIIGALLLCIVLYTALEIAFIGAIPATALVHGWSMLNYVNDSAPFVGLVVAIGIAWYSGILYIDAFISPFGAGLIYAGATARTGYAMGQNGYMFTWLCRMNKNNIPSRLVLFNFFFGLLFFLPFPSWQSMMSFLVSASVLSYAVGPLALLVLRKKNPDYPRPFRLPQAKIISFIAFYVCNLILLWVGWTTIYKMLLMVLCGYVFLWFFRRVEKNTLPLAIKNIYWVLTYFIFIGITSYTATFGGGMGLVPFGYDFLLVLFMSAIIFIWAHLVGCQTV
ncbi:MAG: APC family permease [Pseudomonadota bacterium]